MPMPTTITLQTPLGANANANEEWLEISKIGECRTMKMKMQPKEPKKVSLERMSAQDLRSIKKHDSFLYYSIPGVRSAKMLLKDVDAPEDLATCDELTRNCISSPSRLQTLRGKAMTQTVTRSSCISFECHPDLHYLDDFSKEDFDAYNDCSDDCSYASSDDDCSDDTLDGLLLGWPSAK
ncbi:hypothetical protein ACHAXR_011569 [Thalassiosira sp. AJA248-18]